MSPNLGASPLRWSPRTPSRPPSRPGSFPPRPSPTPRATAAARLRAGACLLWWASWPGGAGLPRGSPRTAAGWRRRALHQTARRQFCSLALLCVCPLPRWPLLPRLRHSFDRAARRCAAQGRAKRGVDSMPRSPVRNSAVASRISGLGADCAAGGGPRLDSYTVPAASAKGARLRLVEGPCDKLQSAIVEMDIATAAARMGLVGGGRQGTAESNRCMRLERGLSAFHPLCTRLADCRSPSPRCAGDVVSRRRAAARRAQGAALERAVWDGGGGRDGEAQPAQRHGGPGAA